MNPEQQSLLSPEVISQQTLLATKVHEAREDLYSAMKKSNVIMKVDSSIKPPSMSWLKYLEINKNPVPFEIIDRRLGFDELQVKLKRFVDLQTQYYQLLKKQNNDV